MPATPMTKATRYFQPEVSKLYVVSAIASLSAPTRIELNGGTDVSADVAALSGWRVTSAQVAVPDMGARFVAQIPGRINVDDSSISFYMGKTGVDIRDVLTRDLDTHVVILDGGDVEASLMDVFKVTVSSVGKMRDLEDAPRLDIQFTIRAFEENVAIPAA